MSVIFISSIILILIGAILLFLINFIGIISDTTYRVVTFLGYIFIAVGMILNISTYRDATTPIDNTFYYIGATIDNQRIAGYTTFITEDGNFYTIDTNPEWDWDSIYLFTMNDNATPDDKTDDEVTVVWVETNP